MMEIYKARKENAEYNMKIHDDAIYSRRCMNHAAIGNPLFHDKYYSKKIEPTRSRNKPNKSIYNMYAQVGLLKVLTR